MKCKYSRDLCYGRSATGGRPKEMKKNVPQEGGKPAHPIKADALKPVVDQYQVAIRV